MGERNGEPAGARKAELKESGRETNASMAGGDVFRAREATDRQRLSLKEHENKVSTNLPRTVIVVHVHVLIVSRAAFVLLHLLSLLVDSLRCALDERPQVPDDIRAQQAAPPPVYDAQSWASSSSLPSRHRQRSHIG